MQRQTKGHSNKQLPLRQIALPPHSKMNNNASDNFEYISQLLTALTTESRANRQETDKIELLLKRVSKQCAISYESLGSEVTDETLKNYNEQNKPSKISRLVNENYDLIYQIEQQRYINSKVTLLIQNITEHFLSIKNFIKEQKYVREQDLDNFVYENFESQIVILESSIQKLDEKSNTSSSNLSCIIRQLQTTCREIDWSIIPRGTIEHKQLIKHLQELDEYYGIKLVDDSTLESISTT